MKMLALIAAFALTGCGLSERYLGTPDLSLSTGYKKLCEEQLNGTWSVVNGKAKCDFDWSFGEP